MKFEQESGSAARWTLCVLLFVGWLAAPQAAGQSPAGEDIGQQAEDPVQFTIQRAIRQMRQAQDLLSNRQTARQTQSLQASVTNELQSLIADLETKSSAKQSGAGAPAGANDEQANANSSPDSQEPVGGEPGAAPENVGSTEAKIWGHLPQRLRQRMRTAGVEEFLPQYEQMLEDYYRRLSREP